VDNKKPQGKIILPLRFFVSNISPIAFISYEISIALY